MFQKYFEPSEHLHFEGDKLPKISRYVLSDDPHWASGYHMHDNETELVWVEKGTVQLMVNANKYTAHAGDIIALEKGNFHMVASDDSDPATTYTCAVSTPAIAPVFSTVKSTSMALPGASTLRESVRPEYAKDV